MRSSCSRSVDKHSTSRSTVCFRFYRVSSCRETTGWTNMAVHFQMSDLISLRANQHRGFLLPRPLRFSSPPPPSSNIALYF